MTTLTLNNSPIKKDFNNSEALNVVIDHLFEKEIQKENVLVNIRIDGENIPFEEGFEVGQERLSTFSNINFEVQTSVELAFEALDSCNDYIDILNSKITELTGLYQAGNNEKADALFNETIDILDLFIQLFSKINSTLGRNLGEEKVDRKDIQNLEIHLLSILKALIPAKEKGDIIMLCDLLEYELIDNLTQWKIKVVPQLKALKKPQEI